MTSIRRTDHGVEIRDGSNRIGIPWHHVTAWTDYAIDALEEHERKRAQE